MSPGTELIGKAALYMDDSKSSSSLTGFANRYCYLVVAKTKSEWAKATANQKRKLKVQFVGFADFF